jgi:hypothetical protein
MKCLQCHSQRIASGTILGYRNAKQVFEPSGVKFFTLSLRRGTVVESFACLDCGFIWLATDAQALNEFMEKHCDQNG